MAFNPQNANGQATMANSQPIVIASDQSAVPISAASLPLPSGAATAAKQDTGNTSLASIDGKITAVNTGAVVISSSALPSGAATSAKQDTGNTSVASIDTKTPALGQALAASSVPVVLTAAQITTLTPVTSVTATQATGTNLHTVVDSGTLTAVTAITNALPTGTNSIGKISDITTSVVPGTGATNLGKAEDAAHVSGDTGVFALGVRNDGANTAFSGTNGDYTPIGTDAQGRVYVVQKSPTATLSNVVSSATNVTLLTANDNRIGATIYNDSTQSIYVKFGTTASNSSFTVLLATNTYYEVPAGYTGRIDGIWVSANGNARVTELT